MISDKKFIELLNLYLDHEISADEVRVLEAEILSNPARHTLYRQYCAMHKGCLELARTFAPQSEMTAAQSASLAPKVARDLEASRAKFGWGAWVGGLGLAAACGALVFFVFSHKHRSAPALSGGTDTFAPALLAAPRAAPLNSPTPSPVTIATPLRAHAGEGRALLAGGGDKASLAGHAFATAAALSAPAPASEQLQAAYSPEYEPSHPATPFHFSAVYTAGPTAMERERLDWGPLIDLREIMEQQTTLPSFRVRPSVTPSPRVYHRKERRFEGGRVEMTRFQFQR